MDDGEEFRPTMRAHDTEHGYAVELEFQPPTREDIADALARRMAQDYTESKALRAMVLDRVQELVREAVDREAGAAIGVSMNQMRQPTDRFGQPDGEPVNFVGLIAAQVQAWQDETVDPHSGQPKSGNSYGNSVITRREWLVRQVGAAEFGKLAKEEVQKVRADAKARVETTIKSAVAEALAALAPK